MYAAHGRQREYGLRSGGRGIEFLARQDAVELLNPLGLCIKNLPDLFNRCRIAGVPQMKKCRPAILVE